MCIRLLIENENQRINLSKWDWKEIITKTSLEFKDFIFQIYDPVLSIWIV